MSLHLRRKYALPALVLAALLLSACETARVVPVREAEPVVSAEAAEAAEREGEFVLAAREYERLADGSRGAARQDFLLRASQSLIRAGEVREARQRLARVDLTGLDSSFVVRKQILEARLLMLTGQHERAARLLHEAGTARNLNPAILAEMHGARAQAELALNNPLGGVRSLVAREHYLAGKEAVAENQTKIWKILEGLKRPQLRSELDLARDDVLAGWIELALIAANALEAPATLEPEIARWKKAYAKHPAGEAIITPLLARTPRLAAHFSRIALLLPITSPYGTAATAVRDGFLAAQQRASDADKPSVQVYDIGSDPAQVGAYYQQAVADGAQMVVGPLGRDATDAIVRFKGITVPTMLLSHVDGNVAGAGSYVFQFGLPPEQEARQVAERALLDGHHRAAVLYPQDAWGERMRQAFVAHWEKLGGTVLASEGYDNPQGDYSESIKRLLNITQSEARKERVAQLVGQKVQFEARARQDIDFIFVAADARRGRLLKPQLNFYRASRIPVYATSHIFTGRADPVRDVDLDGVMFADMPWMLLTEGKVQTLRESLQQGWPHAQSDLDRLYALGVDSFSIVPYLSRISADAAARFSGVTSTLSLDREGRLQRHLIWAQFKRGTPRLLDSHAVSRGRLTLDIGTGG